MAQPEQGERGGTPNVTRQRARDLSPRGGTAAGNSPRPAEARLTPPRPSQGLQQISQLTDSIASLARTFEVAANKKEREENKQKAAQNERDAEIQNLADTHAQYMIQQAAVDPQKSIFFGADTDRIKSVITSSMNEKVGTEFDLDYVAYANQAGYDLSDEDLVTYRRRVMQRAAPKLAELEHQRYMGELNDRLSNYLDNWADTHDDTTSISAEDMKAAEETIDTLMTEMGASKDARAQAIRKFRTDTELMVIETATVQMNHWLAKKAFDSGAIDVMIKRVEELGEGWSDAHAKEKLLTTLYTQRTASINREEAELKQQRNESRAARNQFQADLDEFSRTLAKQKAEERDALFESLAQNQVANNEAFREAVANDDFGQVATILDDIRGAAEKYKDSDPEAYNEIMKHHDQVVTETVNLGLGWAAKWNMTFAIEPELAMGQKEEVVSALQTMVNRLPTTEIATLQNVITRIQETELEQERPVNIGSVLREAQHKLHDVNPQSFLEGMAIFRQVLTGATGNNADVGEALVMLVQDIDTASTLEIQERAVNVFKNLYSGTISATQTLYPILQHLNMVQNKSAREQFFYSTLGVAIGTNDQDFFGTDRGTALMPILLPVGMTGFLKSATVEVEVGKDRPGTVEEYSGFINDVNNFNAQHNKDFFGIVKKATLSQYQVQGWNYNNAVRFALGPIRGMFDERAGRNAADFITYGNVANDEIATTDTFNFVLEGLVNAEIMRMWQSKEIDLVRATPSDLNGIVRKARINIEPKLQENVYQFRGVNDTYVVGYLGPEHPTLHRQILGAGMAANRTMDPYGKTNESPALRALRETVTTMQIIQNNFRGDATTTTLDSDLVSPIVGAPTAIPRMIARGRPGVTREGESLNTTNATMVADYLAGRRPSVFGETRIGLTPINIYDTAPVVERWSEDEWVFRVGREEMRYDIGAMRETEAYKTFMAVDNNRTDFEFVRRVNAYLNEQVAEHLLDPSVSLRRFNSVSEYLTQIDPHDFVTKEVNGYDFDEIWSMR